MAGVSTRRVDDLVKALGCEGISKSQVSRICQELDVVVDGFLGRPLDGGPYPYLWLDALTQKVREDGRIVNVSVVVATAVNGEGKREIIGMDVGTSEDGAFWLAFLRSLSARGLSGVELVVSDAHQGLRGAIAAVFGGASWQRCRTHFMTNLLTRVPRRVQPWMATMVRTIYQQPSPDEVHAQLDRVTDQLGDRFPQVASLLDEAGPDILAFSSFPVAHWKKIWSNNPLERLNKEIRRRTDVVGIFPNRPAVRRLVGAALAEQHDEWVVGRRYLTPNEVNIDTDIAGATDPTYTLAADDLGKTIKVRVSFDDDRTFLETLTSEATATVVTPLTAEFQDAPDKHLGTGVFTFVIAFSEPISISYVTLRDDSLDVTNGSATKAKRVNGQSDRWEITVEPDSDADVTVVLPVTGDCTAQDAVCTRDGTKLSNRSELTVPGPAAANSPATGAPSISGTAQVDETLTVDTSGIDDANGMSGAVFSYQWLADSVDIAGATSDTYTLVEADVGKAVKVRVIFNDDDHNEETLTSPATAAVAAETAVPDAPQSLNVSPNDTGTLDVSWEAPASDGGSAITGYKVQWKRAADSWDTPADVFEATVSRMTHTITGLTDGVEYAVRIIAANDVGDGPPSDEATGTPRETTPPELSTATVDGATLTLTYDEALDEASGLAADAFSVTVGGLERAVDGVSVSGSSVILTLGSTVASGATVTVSYTVLTDAAAPRIQDDAGNPTASFSDQDVENNTPPPANTPATRTPTITGTVRVGETLTAETSAIADADGMSDAVLIYQWLADDADIAGATSDTYTLVDADLEKAVKVRVIFTDNANNEETLTVDTSGIDDANGMSKAVFSYQWLANGADVAGATSDTYTPVADDVGKAIKVKVSFRNDRNHQESLTSAATAAVTAAADDSAVWSATLTVGSIAGYRGFWKDVGMEELTSDVFTLDGVDYTVKVLADSDGPQFYLTLNKALPVGFTLQVGATTLSSQDASIREYSSGATQYGWANQGVILADVDTVEVSLTLAE